MDNYELIRTAHRVYGRCISEVSEITGHSRNTVRKALHGEPWGYKERAHQPFPILEPYLHLIDDWLKEDKKQPRKQRHTARRIYHRLVGGRRGGQIFIVDTPKFNKKGRTISTKLTEAAYFISHETSGEACCVPPARN